MVFGPVGVKYCGKTEPIVFSSPACVETVPIVFPRHADRGTIKKRNVWLLVSQIISWSLNCFTKTGGSF